MRSGTFILAAVLYRSYCPRLLALVQGGRNGGERSDSRAAARGAL
jgi:hypothetical protein